MALGCGGHSYLRVFKKRLSFAGPTEGSRFPNDGLGLSVRSALLQV